MDFWKDIKLRHAVKKNDITDEKKREIIEKADSAWIKMGLTQNQRAFGIATMNVESGFNPSAKNPESTAEGLGQITDRTWKDAVELYNAKFRNKEEPKIYPDVGRGETDAQIKVTGGWITKAWERAKEIAEDPRLKDYSFIETAYGVWHQGVYAKIDDYVNTKGKTVYGIKTFLHGDEFSNKLRTSLNSTYVDAHDAIDKKDIMLKINHPIKNKRSGQTGGTIGETLQRHGKEVWRIKRDGGVRGHFFSE